MTVISVHDEIRKVRLEALKHYLKHTQDYAGNARDDSRHLAADFLAQKVELIKAAIKLNHKEYPGAPAQIWVDGPDGVPVADVKRQSCTEANARLIAAAPELLAALERAVDEIDELHRRAAAKDWVSYSSAHGVATVHIARTFILKARGE